MRAQDDASSDPAYDPPLRSERRARFLGWTGGAAVIGAASFAIFAPASIPRFECRVPWGGASIAESVLPEDWPSPPRVGERAKLEAAPAGPELVVSAATRERAMALARAIARRHASETAPLTRARLALRTRLASSALTGLRAPLSPTAECVALVRARASLGRALARPAASDVPGGPADPATVPDDALITQERAVELAAAAAEPASLERALADAARAEDDWLRDLARSGANPAMVGEAWRAHELERAEALEALARSLSETVPAGERNRLEPLIDARILELEPTCPDPRGAVLAAPETGAAATRPIVRTWAMLLGAGALGGALAMGLGLVLGQLRHRNGRAHMVGPRRLALRRNPATAEGWLHLVSGPAPRRVAQAGLEIAARALAHGERVLLVDGGWRLRLHERFEREARWGLMECLCAGMPLLGLVQYAGRPGLYLLAHGNPARGERWWRLGQLLDDARPHFGRVVLALDLETPREVGGALAGRTLDGWWAGSGPGLPPAAISLSDRLGIALSPMDLRSLPAATLEALEVRIGQLSPAVSQAGARSLGIATEEPSRARVPVLSEPEFLDCDLHVRERLRFLIWMRRVQAESRRTVPVAHAPEPARAH